MTAYTIDNNAFNSVEAIRAFNPTTGYFVQTYFASGEETYTTNEDSYTVSDPASGFYRWYVEAVHFWITPDGTVTGLKSVSPEASFTIP